MISIRDRGLRVRVGPEVVTLTPRQRQRMYLCDPVAPLRLSLYILANAGPLESVWRR